MKKNLLIGILIGLTALSCSSDDQNDLPEPTMAELLVQGSPWTFDHYEMISIIEAGDSDFTQTEIENKVNSREVGKGMIFNQDGTGVAIPSEGRDHWIWELINENQLKLTFGGGDTNTLENISVSSNQLIIEIPSVSYDESFYYEVLHYGKFYYK